MPDENDGTTRYHITLVNEEPGQPAPVPEDIPWQWVASSLDMMDTSYCNQAFPPPWRSSVALYAHNPAPEDLPEALADHRITYLKLTCSITGFQPSDEEIEAGMAAFPNAPQQDLGSLSRLLATYWPCYGVLVNVAVFPSADAEGEEFPWDQLPHILDFEPKSRDLYQTVTATGEVLTASKSSLNIGKSHTHTDSTETGLSGGAKVGGTPPKETGGFGWEANLGFTHKWGETDKDVQSVTTDASQEHSDKHAAVTELKQMYNLLTGYHAGTNRAVFLMLPRPHTRQPTSARSFVQGLRVIEGMQDFFLIVSRPRGQEQICVEVSLDTGHFPDNVAISPPQPEYETDLYEFEHNVFVPKRVWGKRSKSLEKAVPGLDADGWEFDRSEGDPGHPAIRQTVHEGDTAERYGRSRLENYEYQVQDPGTALVTGTLSAGWIHDRRFHRTFTVYRRRGKELLDEEPRTEVDRLLVTRRNLCACFPPSLNASPYSGLSWILGEPMIELGTANLGESAYRQTTMAAQWDLLDAIHRGMLRAGRPLWSRSPGEVGFLETDWFKEKIRELLPGDYLQQNISEVRGLPEQVVAKLRDLTVAEALILDLESFASKTGLRMPEAVRARRRLLRLQRSADHDGSAAPE